MSGGEADQAGEAGGMVMGRTLHSGRTTGQVMRLGLPLSFWGGTDHDGTIIDRHHPQCGESVVGRVLVMQSGRGSSSSSYVLAEAIRSGHAPAAIVLAEPDAIVVLGAIVATELYELALPIVQVGHEHLDVFGHGTWVDVVATEDGSTIAFSNRGAGRL